MSEVRESAGQLYPGSGECDEVIPFSWRNTTLFFYALHLYSRSFVRPLRLAVRFTRSVSVWLFSRRVSLEGSPHSLGCVV